MPKNALFLLKKCGRYGVQIPSRSNLPLVANDSPSLRPLLCRPWHKAAELGIAHSWSWQSRFNFFDFC